MRGISFQLGPRFIGRGLLAARAAVTRARVIVLLLVATVLVQVVLGVVYLRLNTAAVREQPPTAFCPAGQHVVSVTASGWPDCAGNP